MYCVHAVALKQSLDCCMTPGKFDIGRLTSTASRAAILRTSIPLSPWGKRTDSHRWKSPASSSPAIPHLEALYSPSCDPFHSTLQLDNPTQVRIHRMAIISQNLENDKPCCSSRKPCISRTGSKQPRCRSACHNPDSSTAHRLPCRRDSFWR